MGLFLVSALIEGVITLAAVRAIERLNPFNSCESPGFAPASPALGVIAVGAVVLAVAGILIASANRRMEFEQLALVAFSGVAACAAGRLPGAGIQLAVAEPRAGGSSRADFDLRSLRIHRQADLTKERLSLHHVVVERWSRQKSPLHARDARAKLGALLVFLISVSTTDARAQTAFAAYAALLLAAIAAARLPFDALLRRAALVLPFSATFALITWWSGEPARASGAGREKLSIGTRGAAAGGDHADHRPAAWPRMVRVPRMLILVIQFLYRYLFVISEQAQHMRAGGGEPSRI